MLEINLTFIRYATLKHRFNGDLEVMSKVIQSTQRELTLVKVNPISSYSLECVNHGLI